MTTEIPRAVAESSALLDSAPASSEVLGRYAPRRNAATTWTELRNHLGRLLRYSLTSGVALGVSEATLLGLYSTRTFGATTAAFLANLVGTLPSYLLSRYWIWRQADRRRVGRQVVLYWLISFVSMAITSLATGAITEAAPSGHEAHVIVAGIGFLLVSVVLWVAKYVVYQQFVFQSSSAQLEPTR